MTQRDMIKNNLIMASTILEWQYFVTCFHVIHFWFYQIEGNIEFRLQSKAIAIGEV